MSAICKFSDYCVLLKELYDPSYTIPLPTPLPTKLAELHNDQTLLEDVWITHSHGEIPLWLKDCDVRSGIWALLMLNCCHEEQLCLRMEADNLCWWFGRKLCVVEFALQQPQCKSCCFIYLALFTGDVECSIRFHILPCSEATAWEHKYFIGMMAKSPCFCWLLCQCGPHCIQPCHIPIQISQHTRTTVA